MKVIINGVEYVPKTVEHKTVYDILKPLEGAKEWDSTVEMIQRWFYDGSFPKTPWCATTITYALAMLGIRAKTMKNRHENVYNMLMDIRETGTAKLIDYTKETVKRGDIIFLDYGVPMTTTSNKHVTSCESDTKPGSLVIPCMGGNQKDSICTVNYPITSVHCIYRPDYS